MEWLRYTITGREEDEERLTSALTSLGLDSLEIIVADPLSDADKAALFLEPAPELQPEEAVPKGCLKIRFYLHSVLDPDPAVMAQTADYADDSYTIHDRRYTPEEIRQIELEVGSRLDRLMEEGVIGETLLEKDRTAESEWRDNWKKYFHPIEADGLLILPVWNEIPEEAKARLNSGELKLLSLEPGTAFGTGAHASTRLCLDGMMNYLKPGDRLLDIGTGSGILALAALLNDAESVTATEVDPSCEAVVEENLRLNELENGVRLRLLMGDILTDRAIMEKAEAAGKYDLITANILAPVIERLGAPGAADRYLRAGGVFVGSGISLPFADEVAEVFAANPSWRNIRTFRLDEWAAVTAERTEAFQTS